MELVWDEIRENQRWFLHKGWADCPRIPPDPAHWTNEAFQKVASIQDHRLPSEEDENNWIWVDDWQESDWKYAISFGATIGSFTFTENRSKKHFVRQKLWKRPRIRKIQIGVTEIEEYVNENQRIMIKMWKSPYFPGDRPHYTDKNHHLCTKKQIESRLPPSWLWVEPEWNPEIGEHTDTDGWEYATDFHVGGWASQFKPFVHNVRRRKWLRTRKLAGLIKETKKLERPSSASKSVESIVLDPNATPIIVDEKTNDIDMDDGWGDDDAFVSDSPSELPPPKPPFEIDICWTYDKVFRETKQEKTLAIWSPKLKDHTCFILGYLALNHRVNPNDNIPILVVKNGSDAQALKPPQRLHLIHQETIKKRDKRNNKQIAMFRYWLTLIPPSGYIAMGSIVVETWEEPIPKSEFHDLIGYLRTNRPRYYVDKLRCVAQKYVDTFGQPLVEKLLTSHKSQFTLHRAQPLVVSGVYKLVEMACIIRQPASFTKAQSKDNNVKMEHYTGVIKARMMNACVRLWQYNIRIVVDSPLVISYATHFKLAWSSKRITDTSNTKAAVWEPVLGPDENMVGHLAYGDWLHPTLHRNNCKLLIIKSGGSDPDAFKEPLGFECIWSVYQPGQKKRLKNKSFGSGLLLSKVGGRVGLVDDEPPPSASFWRAIPPQGYTPLGDIALPIDGVVAGSNEDGTKSKVRVDALLRSYDVPAYVCIKNEYLAQFRELEVDLDGDGKDDIIENKVRSRIWNSERCKGLKLHAAIYEQEAVSRDILSPMLCKLGFTPPASCELLPTLKLKSVIEDQPHWTVVKAGVLRKKGEGFMAQAHKRLFVLTNDKMMNYYDGIQMKGSIDLKEMKECDVVNGSDNEFYIDTPQRKWQLEVDNDEDDDEDTTIEWVNAIRSVQNSIEFETADEASESKSQAVMKEEKESEEQKIVVLLSRMLDEFGSLLKKTRSENETTESVATAVQWYEDLEHTQCAIDILLAKWPRGTICPPGVVAARGKVADLMREAQQVILDDICALANENMSNSTVLRLHRACCLMCDMPSSNGQRMVSQWITEVLLANASVVFAAGNKDSDLAHIDRRFNEYRRQMKDYDKRYNRFIPKWWNLPIQIGSRFCSLMGETLDDQLTQYPESCDAISIAKQKCVTFERELIEDAQRRLCGIEIDVRSWTKFGDDRDTTSYIKIDDEDIMIRGVGICVIALDLLTKKVLKKKLFPIYKYSAFKQRDKHKRIMREWLQYLSDIDDRALIIMASNEWSGHCEFKKSLHVDLPQELSDLHIELSDFAEERNLWLNKEPFIYIGRKCRRDPYFTLLKGTPKYARAVMCRHIITPYIPPNVLATLVDKDSIPFYEGIVSQVLERHLDIFVGVEAKHVQKILQSVQCEEEMNELEAKKQWLSAINNAGENYANNAHLDSVLKIANCMKKGIENCMKISNGKPLLDLLTKYNQLLSKYATVLAQLLNDSGGNRLRGKLLPLPGDIISHLIENKSPRQRGVSFAIGNMMNMAWNTQEIQFFVIYACLVYNSCAKSRELVSELIGIGTSGLQAKYRSGGRLKSSLRETRDLFVSIEDQCLQCIRVAVMEKFDLILQFEKHMEWQVDDYNKELSVALDAYLTNCSKLLTPAAVDHFYKVFAAHFALRMVAQLLHSQTLHHKASSVWIFLPSILQSLLLKKVPKRVMKKMQIYTDRCFNPITKLIELAYAKAGNKYLKSDRVDIESIAAKTENIFNKFFGGAKTESKSNIINDSNTQNQQVQITEIAKTEFAQRAVQFYIDNAISLQILSNVPSYKEIFADDDDDPLIIFTANQNENENDSDSPSLPAADVVTKSVSGFSVKKHIKKKKRAPPPPMKLPPRVPSQNIATNPSLEIGKGLSAASLCIKQNVKLNRKWSVIEKIMALRGFDVADQRTIKILCQNAQSNVDSQKI
eukprot:1103337_1